jgi:hypothetical protein
MSVMSNGPILAFRSTINISFSVHVSRTVVCRIINICDVSDLMCNHYINCHVPVVENAAR